MEVKVWMDGYQRIVCGVTEQTTCQDIMIALAQATGLTGRYAMFEKWRASEHRLSPADYPLLVLQKWGEYSNDVQLILRHSSVTSGASESKRRIHPGLGRRPERDPPERTALKKSLTFSGAHRRSSSAENPARIRITKCARNICHSVESSEQSSLASQSSASLSPYMSLERQMQGNCGNIFISNLQKDGLCEPNGMHLSKQEHRISKDKMQISVASEKCFSAQDQRFQVSPDHSRAPAASTRQGKPPTSTSAVPSQTPRPNQGVGKKVLQFQNGMPGSHIGIPFISNSQKSSKLPSFSNTSSSSNTPTSLNLPTDFDEVDAGHDLSVENLVIDPVLNACHTQTHLPKLSEFGSQEEKNAHSESNKTPFKETHLPNEQENFKGHNKISDAKKQITRSVKTTASVPLASATTDNSLVSISRSSAPLHPLPDKVVSRKACPSSSVKSGHIKSEGASKEAEEKRELVMLISQQEEEIQKCESRLKDLNCEISLLEGDLDIDEKHLESHMKKIEEMEALEKEVENELEELELVSWEEKLELEKEKENRIRTEILLLQSSISKSEAEVRSFVDKIKSLTAKTEEATQEFNQFLEKKREKENKTIAELEESLRQASMESQMTEMALKSLEEETKAAELSLSKKKKELTELEFQLQKLNLEIFLQEPPEIGSSRRGRATVIDRLGLSRPGSSRRLQRCQLNPSPHQFNYIIDKARNHSHGYIV